MGHRELARLRSREEDLAGLADSGRASTTQAGMALVVETATKAAYPTTAQTWYYCRVQEVSGPPTENGEGELDGIAAFLYAFNIGKQIPPAGTQVLATLAGNCGWVINFNG